MDSDEEVENLYIKYFDYEILNTIRVDGSDVVDVSDFADTAVDDVNTGDDDGSEDKSNISKDKFMRLASKYEVVRAVIQFCVSIVSYSFLLIVYTFSLQLFKKSRLPGAEAKKKSGIGSINNRFTGARHQTDNNTN